MQSRERRNRPPHEAAVPWRIKMLDRRFPVILRRPGLLSRLLGSWVAIAILSPSAIPDSHAREASLTHAAAATPSEPGSRGPAGHPPPASDGPWNRDVIVYRVGRDGSVQKNTTFERAGVPTIARLGDGRILVAHQHFPEDDGTNFDKVAVRASGDDGRTWSDPRVIRVDGLPEGMRFPFDPTLVPLPDGRVRLYFTGNLKPSFQGGTPAIHSAISNDGLDYTFEPGVRFAIEGRQVIDCAVVLHRGVFHLYAPHTGKRAPGMRPGDENPEDRPRQGAGYYATSADGLNFTRQPDVQIEGRGSWLGNAQSDGRLITFYGTGEGKPIPGPGGQPQGGLWIASSPDGRTWTPVAAPPIRGGDPGAVTTRDGGLLVVITSEPVRKVTTPRPGSPSARPPPEAERRGDDGRDTAHPRGDINRPAPGTEAAAEYYTRVNPDSEFTPRRGGVPAPGGPAPMRLMLATSADGLAFERRNLIVTDQGAVPDLVVDRNGWIWLYYQSASVGDDVNRVALALSKDNGASWTFRRVTLTGFSSPKPDPCDPEIQLAEDETFRLFLTWPEPGQHPVSWLAESRDGVNFNLVGKAFDPGGQALDPSIVKIGDTWHIFAGGGRGPNENWHGTSRDGRTFTAAGPKRFTAGGVDCMMANGLSLPDGGARFYAFNNMRPGQPHRIFSFSTRDSANWIADPGIRLDAGGLAALEDPGFGVLDPAVGRLKDGGYLMVYTTRIPGTRTPRRGPGPGADNREFRPIPVTPSQPTENRNAP